MTQMKSGSLNGAATLVIGAGIMGAGIAQVAAQSGHAVWLFDAREGAATLAKTKLAATLDGLVAKGRIEAEQAHATLARITPIAALNDASTETRCRRAAQMTAASDGFQGHTSPLASQPP